MNERRTSVLRAQVTAKAVDLLRVPGVLAAESGYRIRGGKLTDEPVVSVIVERKLPPDELRPSEDLRALFGAQNVDVVEASPLQALFAQPERYGVDADTLKAIEDKVGWPFSAEAVGPRPLRAAITAAPRDAARAAGIPDHISYRPPPDSRLDPASGRIRLRCHASPDCGWRELRGFINQVERELVVGMYELTAPHIGDLLVQHLGDKHAALRLTLDEGQNIGKGIKADDRREEVHLRMFRQALGNGFASGYALTTGREQTFDTDYHIKLAVRDGAAFWLSSGSWQSSNQPPLDPLGADAGSERLKDCNREWHVIVEHRDLTGSLQRFLEADLTTAQRVGHPTDAIPVDRLNLRSLPDVFVSDIARGAIYNRFFDAKDFEFEASSALRVVPLLTPDNFVEAITQEIARARHKLYVQNQSLTFLQKQTDQDPRYTEFARILAEKSHSVDDFRLILRDPEEFFGSRAAALSTYHDKGFNTARIRFQANCHNKGVLIDDEVLLLGSHNLTNAGTTANRDATLLVQHRDVVAYYEPIFLHDWDVAETGPSPRRARLAQPGEMAPPGMHRVSFFEAFDFD
jgi:PLD-like domain